jgi:hypothetical protein
LTEGVIRFRRDSGGDHQHADRRRRHLERVDRRHVHLDRRSLLGRLHRRRSARMHPHWTGQSSYLKTK